MKRLIHWLSEKFAAKKPDSDRTLRQTGAYVIPRPARQNAPPKLEPVVLQNVDYSADLGGKIIDGGPGKNVLIRNKYVREDSGTHETLKIVDDSLLDSDEEFGLDPYNTGRFDRSKYWNNSRK